MKLFNNDELKQISKNFNLVQVGGITIWNYQQYIARVIEANNGVVDLRKVIIEKDTCSHDYNVNWCICYEDRPTVGGLPALEWWVPTKELALELCNLFNLEIAYIIDKDFPTIKSILLAKEHKLVNNYYIDDLMNLNLNKLDSSSAENLKIALNIVLKCIKTND
jgi:hypothetical protein